MGVERELEQCFVDVCGCVERGGARDIFSEVHFGSATVEPLGSKFDDLLQLRSAAELLDHAFRPAGKGDFHSQVICVVINPHPEIVFHLPINEGGGIIVDVVVVAFFDLLDELDHVGVRVAGQWSGLRGGNDGRARLLELFGELFIALGLGRHFDATFLQGLQLHDLLSQIVDVELTVGRSLGQVDHHLLIRIGFLEESSVFIANALPIGLGELFGPALIRGLTEHSLNTRTICSFRRSQRLRIFCSDSSSRLHSKSDSRNSTSYPSVPFPVLTSAP